jgi:hypothetical protein
MTGRTYPQFPAGIEVRLAAVKMAGGEGAAATAYLSDPACPYPDALKQVLRAWLDPWPENGDGTGGGLDGNLGVAPIFQDGISDEKATDVVLDEVQRTIDAMRNIERSLASDDTDGKLNLLKQKTGLLEKWVQIKERTTGLKQIAEFQRMVLTALDGIMDKDKIQEFKKRLTEIGENG